jgi:signal transduction histidine kinase
MRNATAQTDTSVRLDNPHLKKCYEEKTCEKKDCACYGKEAMRCWQVAGTYCGGQVQGAFAQKYGNCSQCEVFKEATSDPIYQIGEQFNNMMHVLEVKNRNLEDAYMKIKSFAMLDKTGYGPADINDCIESTLNMVGHKLTDRAAVEKEYGKLPLTDCHPRQMTQVFMNLFVNAAQAIDDHGEIKIKTWDSDGTINVSISDTGCGIQKEELKRIFDPFFTTKDSGAGLGLSISYDIVKKHKGEIAVDSEVDKGTTFTIKIPVVKRDENV